MAGAHPSSAVATADAGCRPRAPGRVAAGRSPRLSRMRRRSCLVCAGDRTRRALSARSMGVWMNHRMSGWTGMQSTSKRAGGRHGRSGADGDGSTPWHTPSCRDKTAADPPLPSLAPRLRVSTGSRCVGPRWCCVRGPVQPRRPGMRIAGRPPHAEEQGQQAPVWVQGMHAAVSTHHACSPVDAAGHMGGRMRRTTRRRPRILLPRDPSRPAWASFRGPHRRLRCDGSLCNAPLRYFHAAALVQFGTLRPPRPRSRPQTKEKPGRERRPGFGCTPAGARHITRSELVAQAQQVLPAGLAVVQR